MLCDSLNAQYSLRRVSYCYTIDQGYWYVQPYSNISFYSHCLFFLIVPIFMLPFVVIHSSTNQSIFLLLAFKLPIHLWQFCIQMPDYDTAFVELYLIHFCLMYFYWLLVFPVSLCLQVTTLLKLESRETLYSLVKLSDRVLWSTS